MSQPRSHVNVTERDGEGRVVHDSRVDGPGRAPRPLTAASVSPWKPLHLPTRREPTAEETEMLREYNAIFGEHQKQGPPPAEER
jgi:hypothetical protein